MALCRIIDGVRFYEIPAKDTRPDRYYWETEGGWARVYKPVDPERLNRKWLLRFKVWGKGRL